MPRPIAILLTLLAPGVAAQEPPRQSTSIEVVGVTPVDGVGIDRAKFPTNAQRIVRPEGGDVQEALLQQTAAVQLNDPSGGPLLPDLQFRGVSVSPLLGAPEGLALFQDGVRLNEPFGDTIAWTTVPAAAIDSIEVIPGANPVFGLNALGGALAIRTRSAMHGLSALVRAGSTGRLDAELATGAASWFLSASHLRDEGWRDFSPSDVTQLFASTRHRSGDFRLTLGRSRVTGNGAIPVELAALEREAVFTHPDETRNTFGMLSTHHARMFGASLLAEGTAYARRSDTRTLNGDDSPYEPCAGGGLLCLEEEVVHDAGGAPVPLPPGTVYDGTNNRTHLTQTAFGAAVQLDRTRTSRTREHRLIAGASIDGGVAAFRASTELAELTAERGTTGSGIVTADSLVALNTRSTTFSAFAADILSLTPRLTVTATARLDHVRMRLDDQIGVALDGRHTFTRFHPSIGAAFALSGTTSAFANAGATGRTPTPVELSCADPEDPCRLPNAFVSDPPLRAVRGRSYEAGLRGSLRRASWSVAAYRATNSDDLLFISSGPLRGEGHFANVGTTRRQGLELAVSGRTYERVALAASYAFIDARFVTPFVVAAPHHPRATGDEIAVEAGDRLPLVPRHMGKLSATLDVTRRLTAGVALRAVSEQYFRGDEANLEAPLPGYTVADARLDLRIGGSTTVALELRNAFDAEYATFGLFGDAEDVLGEAYEESSRFITPAAPRTVMVSVRTTF